MESKEEQLSRLRTELKVVSDQQTNLQKEIELLESSQKDETQIINDFNATLEHKVIRVTSQCRDIVVGDLLDFVIYHYVLSAKVQRSFDPSVYEIEWAGYKMVLETACGNHANWIRHHSGTMYCGSCHICAKRVGDTMTLGFDHLGDKLENCSILTVDEAYADMRREMAARHEKAIRRENEVVNQLLEFVSHNKVN